jgi:hypothetical protein
LVKTQKILRLPYSREIIFLKEFDALLDYLYLEIVSYRVSSEIEKEIGKVTVGVSFSETGEVGKIALFSTVEEKYIKPIVKSIRHARFIPAQIDAKNATDEKVLAFTVTNKRIFLTDIINLGGYVSK